MGMGFRVAWGIVVTCVVAWSASACDEKDTEPPAPPVVDPIDTPTGETALLVTGTAEFGATVRVQGGAATIETTADPYTARWFAPIELADGDNLLAVTATDAAGNESEATRVTVVHVDPGEPATITIDGPTSARAGEAVVFEVHVYNAVGDEIPAAAYTLTTDATAGTTTLTPPATVGFCEVGATVVTAQAGAGGPSASHQLAISAGRSVVADLVLGDNAVTAGTTVTYTAEARDGCDNVTTDFFDIYTNAPGAVIAAGSITGLTRAGSWTVVAQVPGTSAVDTEMLLVDADESSTAIVLQLTQTSAFVGVPIGYGVTAVDGFGNPVDQTTLVITTTNVGAVVDSATRTITFSTAGSPSHTVTATLFGGTADVVSDSGTVLVTNPDLSSPTVAVVAPVAGVVVAPGGVLSVTVRASDDLGLAQIFLQANGAGVFDFQQQLVPRRANGDPETGPYDAFFTVDVGGNAFGQVTLVAQAVDAAGNYTSSTSVVVIVDPAANIFVAGGLTISTVGWRGNLRRPRGIAVDATDAVYVTNNDSGFPLVLRLDPAVAPPNNQSTVVIPQTGRNGEDIVFYDDPDVADPNLFFVSYTGVANRLARVNAGTGALTLGWSADVGQQPRGMIVESSSSIAAIYDDRRVRRFAPTTGGTNVAVSSSMIADTVLGDAWGLEALSFGCRAGQFQCANGACIDRALVCNTVNSCGDSSDEGASCASPGVWNCPSGGTTSVTNICDGDNDCATGSDEARCSRYAATDSGANDEAWRFYDNGNGVAVTHALRVGSNLNNPRGIARNVTARYLYVASRDGNAIFQIDLAQVPVCDGNCPVIASGFDEAWGLAFDAGGDLLITDHGADAVFRIAGLP